MRRTTQISIHSPHTRGDSRRTRQKTARENFNPLPSHEGRLEADYIIVFGGTFQSTPLTRGETCSRPYPGFRARRFQSTPLTRGETGETKLDDGRQEFQSTPLTRGETSLSASERPRPLISIHSPHTRGDLPRLRDPRRHQYFNPLPSHEGRQRKHALVKLD